MVLSIVTLRYHRYTKCCISYYNDQYQNYEKFKTQHYDNNLSVTVLSATMLSVAIKSDILSVAMLSFIASF